MVDATRVFEPGFQVTNAAGTPQSGAVLRFYNAGTSNTRTVYSDLGLSVSLGVTVTTNASGRPAASGGAGAEILIYTGTTAYKVTAETSAGVSLWSFDNVIGALDTSAFLTGSVIAETTVIAKTADYTILTSDQGKIVNGNPTGGTFTLTLPSAVTAGDGWRVGIRNVGTANQVNIAPVSAQTIDGQTSAALTVYAEGLTLVSDGANWHIADTDNPAINARSLTTAGVGFSIIGGNIIASVSGNVLTFAVKTSAGNDPTAYNPVKVIFRGQSAADEEFALFNITAANSINVPDTALLGTTNNTAFRLWVVGFNDGGTFRLGVINCLSGTSVYPLGSFPIASSTAVGTGSDSAHVIYTGSAVSSKPYRILGYATWESGLGTAGTWSAAPTRYEAFGPNTHLPGERIQVQRNSTGAVSTGTTTMPLDDTIPQNTEGDQYLSQSITPGSAANIIETRTLGHFAKSTASLCAALFQDSTANAVSATTEDAAANNAISVMELNYAVLAGGTSAITMKLRAGLSSAGTMTFNGASAARLFGGAAHSFIRVEEIMA